MDETVYGFALVVWIVLLIVWIWSFAYAGYTTLDRFDRGVEGALLGVFLGPIGLWIAWIARDNEFCDREERDRQHPAAEPEKLRRDPTAPRRFR